MPLIYWVNDTEHKTLIFRQQIKFGFISVSQNQNTIGFVILAVLKVMGQL